MSDDWSGRERSQDEQHDENTEAGETTGVTLGLAYRDAGSASASRCAKKTRDDFARLLGDLAAGRFGADVLVLWESSRGSRKVGEWVELVLVDRWFPSSTTCSWCGSVRADLNLADRTYPCATCGLVIDPDVNAAINLARYTPPLPAAA